MKLNDFVAKQRKAFNGCDFKKINEQSKENLSLMQFGYTYVKGRSFYEFLSADGFLQMTLDYRGYEKRLKLIGNSIHRLLKKDDVLSDDNKQF